MSGSKYKAGYTDENVTIIKELEIDNTKTSYNSRKRFLCECKQCGESFEASYYMVAQYHTANLCKKCKSINRKHPYYGTRIYSIWYSMKCRCNYEKHPHYNNYGGRGIKVCDEWDNDSIAFCEWALANGYQDDLTIDRIDNDKGYSPENCRWVTKKEQVQNRRTHKPYCNSFTFNGVTKSIDEWCEFFGTKRKTFEKRYYVKHMDPYLAFTLKPYASSRKE